MEGSFGFVPLSTSRYRNNLGEPPAQIDGYGGAGIINRESSSPTENYFRESTVESETNFLAVEGALSPEASVWPATSDHAGYDNESNEPNLQPDRSHSMDPDSTGLSSFDDMELDERPPLPSAPASQIWHPGAFGAGAALSSTYVSTVEDPWSPYTSSGLGPWPSQVCEPTLLHEPSYSASAQSCGCSSTSGIHGPITPMSSLNADSNQMSDSLATLKAVEELGRPLVNLVERVDAGWQRVAEFSKRPILAMHGTDSHMLKRYLGNTLDPTIALSGGNRTSFGTPSGSSNSHERGFLGLSNTHLSPSVPSRAPSIVSAASSSVADPIVCEVCGRAYSGEYRRGNLARHKRHKHGLEEQIYPCEEPGCEKEFKRQDARKKHYRRRHPHLAPEPFVPRLH